MAYRLEGSFDSTGGLRGIRPRLYGDRPVGDPKVLPSGSQGISLISGGRYGGFDAFNVGNGVLVSKGPTPINDIQISEIAAQNVYRFLETEAALTNFLVEKISLYGAERGLARFKGASGPGKIINFVADLGGAKYEGDPFQMGVHIDGASHDIEIADGTIKNCHQTVPAGYYPQGDGVVTERGTDRIRLTRLAVSACSDGGFDLKGGRVELRACQADSCGRSLRAWMTSGWADTFTSRRPKSAHVNLLDGPSGVGSSLVIDKLVFESTSAAVPILRLNAPAGGSLIIRSWQSIGPIPPEQIVELHETPGTTVTWTTGRPPGRIVS